MELYYNRIIGLTIAAQILTVKGERLKMGTIVDSTYISSVATIYHEIRPGYPDKLYRWIT